MPCRVDDDFPTRYAKETRHGLTIADFEAVLCGVFTAAQDGVVTGYLDGLIDVIDWKEVGVSRKAVVWWWNSHKKEDEKRREREAIAKRKDDLKKAALAKLTAEERAALGI